MHRRCRPRAQWSEAAGNKPGKSLDRGALCRSQVFRRAGREHEEFALIAVQLDRVTGEVSDLVSIQLNDRFVSGLKSSPEGIARGWVLDHIESDEGKFRSDTKHHVGVIDRSLIIANALKRERLKIEISAKSLERFASARRERET